MSYQRYARDMTAAETPKPLPLHLKVAATVRAEMARAGLLQTDLAYALGLAQQAVSARLRGKTPFTLADIDALADLFGTTAEDLVAGVPSPRVGIAPARKPENPRRPKSTGASRGAVVAGTGFEPVTSGL